MRGAGWCVPALANLPSTPNATEYSKLWLWRAQMSVPDEQQVFGCREVRSGMACVMKRSVGVGQIRSGIGSGGGERVHICSARIVDLSGRQLTWTVLCRAVRAEREAVSQRVFRCVPSLA